MEDIRHKSRHGLTAQDRVRNTINYLEEINVFEENIVYTDNPIASDTQEEELLFCR